MNEKKIQKIEETLLLCIDAKGTLALTEGKTYILLRFIKQQNKYEIVDDSGQTQFYRVDRFLPQRTTGTADQGDKA